MRKDSRGYKLPWIKFNTDAVNNDIDIRDKPELNEAQFIIEMVSFTLVIVVLRV